MMPYRGGRMRINHRKLEKQTDGSIILGSVGDFIKDLEDCS